MEPIMCPKQKKKSIHSSVGKTKTTTGVLCPHCIYTLPGKLPAPMSPIQFQKNHPPFRKIDEKTERWRQQGKKNWKHGRKLKYDQKMAGQSNYVPTPVVARLLWEKNFNETDYISWGTLVESGYYEQNNIATRIREIMAPLLEEDLSNFDAIALLKKDEILAIPGIIEYFTSTGNCAAMADYLFNAADDTEGTTVKDETADMDMSCLIGELHEKVPRNKMKLIRILSNFGHAFTLICYNQEGLGFVELIQAWQGEYSVQDSLSKGLGNIFPTDRLIAMLSEIEKVGSSHRYFQKLFLLDKPNAPFGIKQMDIKLLDMTPEQYAEQLISKSLNPDKYT